MTGTNEIQLTTTKRSLRIIELLEERSGATLTEISDELDLAPSTVHGHMETLIQLDYVVREGKIYDLGAKFLSFGNYVMNRKEAYSAADRYTDRVVDETSCRSIFAVEEHGKGVYISRNAGEYSRWRHELLGNRFYLHATAAGKAVLANLPEERVWSIVEDHGLPAKTENTITDEEELFAELETVRERGVAFNREEHIEGIRAVSAPVYSSDRVIGALSANAPANQMVGEWYETELPEILLGITNEFELEISLGIEESESR